MRVLYFHQHFSTPSGASGTRSYELARRLVKRGHEVTLICGTNLRARPRMETPSKKSVVESEIDGIKVIEVVLPYSNHDGLLKRSTILLRFAFASLKFALSREYDLIFTTSTPLTVGIPGIAAKIFRRKPFIFEVRDLWPELPKAMGAVTNPIVLLMLEALERASYMASDACVALAPGIAEGIRKKSGPGHPIAMIPNACDLGFFGRIADRGKAYPELPSDDLICVYAGAHGQANGLDAALDAAAVLNSRSERGIALVFIGDGREKPRLMQRKEAEGLGNCYFFDLMPKGNLADALAAADVGMQLLANIPAFYYGTSPNKFFDYIATGIPVLNNYPGWVADLIEENECGVAVPADDPAAFADALVSLRDNREGRASMCIRSRELAESEFSREVLAEEFCEFLERYGDPSSAAVAN